ncbi:MAG: hypothetical protein A3I11_02290 [Elusimicrobia bacterium RIFCSPLOWO2_02_FULL_39_32]|nr:MAG: hypothetical protein A2034_03635 [Elusimicrobia bacterium GWA2_38_7]OGR78447.1 MAG: hypothetical protein A3B80_07175 [Elusimicrobia bacterium RIFCSPHIGHO2_02_FULL_39_36]OGR92206.1 MAG: hypothetical protein A3I11_02290 [Elusimicrobia bacterium RIFCSPLOWO2_02_FULL_39_32]OGR99927.1 MAG: hypothetical protein A3G85_03150 [Elusimicrobia bacterium RIFCSPLOWO2_12_FULL_39_28]
MEIFWRLMLGHFIADFTLQTNYIAAWKRRNVWGLIVHCAIHPILYTILLWNYVGQVWLQIGTIKLTGCTCILLVFIAHLIEDEWRIWSVLKKGAPDNTFFYLWDQAIHYAIIFAFSPVVDGSTGKYGLLNYPPITGVLNSYQAMGMDIVSRFSNIVRSENWVIVGILIALVTHFTTVTIYFLEKDFFGFDFPETKEKYITMAERVLVMGCFLLPGAWWLAVVAVWILRTVIYKVKKVYDLTWLNILLGNSIAVVCGIAARILVY